MYTRFFTYKALDLKLYKIEIYFKEWSDQTAVNKLMPIVVSIPNLEEMQFSYCYNVTIASLFPTI